LISFTDRYIGRFLDHLDIIDIRDETI